MRQLTKTIAWVVNRLDRMGGGERLLLEGVKYYREQGYRAIVITWFFDEDALFDGAYENKDIYVLGTTEAPRSKIIQRAWSRFRTLGKLRKILKGEGVTQVFVQGEYDVALVYLATLFSHIRYRFIVFGQMFQYPHDIAKYALVFRRHLRAIVASRPGYTATVRVQPPRRSPLNWLANELISMVRLLAVRGAERRFCFSRQMQWETRLLFGSEAVVAAGAFPKTLLGQTEFSNVALGRYGLVENQYILSLSRLDRKKRIDLIIDGFAQSGTADTLVIAGSGDDEVFLRQCAAKTLVADRILFTGRVDDVDMIPLKRHAKLFVSMDVGDYDISPLEALAVGTPALCCTDFDAHEKLESMSGFRRIEPTVNQLSEALAAWSQDPPIVDRDLLAYFTWERYFGTLDSR